MSDRSAKPRRDPVLEIRDLRVSVEGTPILKGVELSLEQGAFDALMGPNGSGKSTLAQTLLGSPSHQVTSGQILFKGQDITAWSPDDRGRAGLFLAFQSPSEIPGVSVRNFLRSALSQRLGINFTPLELRLKIRDKLQMLGMDPDLADRYVNDGFSGGEKKRMEILQMAILEPELAILDETDSGLDIDALRIVAEGVTTIRAGREHLTGLLITHYQRILDYITPDRVHVLMGGRIVASGGPELAHMVESEGYEAFHSLEPVA
jgi:Fe-S cluster assembly ATP-binding protein